MQRIHDPRDEPAARAEQDPPDLEQGNPADDLDHHQEIQSDPAAAEAEHLRGGYDFAVAIFGREVSAGRADLDTG